MKKILPPLYPRYVYLNETHLLEESYINSDVWFSALVNDLIRQQFLIGLNGFVFVTTTDQTFHIKQSLTSTDLCLFTLLMTHLSDNQLIQRAVYGFNQLIQLTTN